MCFSLPRSRNLLIHRASSRQFLHAFIWDCWIMDRVCQFGEIGSCCFLSSVMSVWIFELSSQFVSFLAGSSVDVLHPTNSGVAAFSMFGMHFSNLSTSRLLHLWTQPRYTRYNNFNSSIQRISCPPVSTTIELALGQWKLLRWAPSALEKAQDYIKMFQPISCVWYSHCIYSIFSVLKYLLTLYIQHSSKLKYLQRLPWVLDWLKYMLCYNLHEYSNWF